MKILLVTTHLEIGGIARYVTNLAKILKRRGHTVFVASSGGRLEEILTEERIKHIHLDIRTKSELSPKIMRSFSRLKPFLKNEEVDLVHAHTRVTQVLSELISRRCKIPYVTTCHGFFKRRIGRRIPPPSFKSADTSICQPFWNGLAPATGDTFGCSSTHQSPRRWHAGSARTS